MFFFFFNSPPVCIYHAKDLFSKNDQVAVVLPLHLVGTGWCRFFAAMEVVCIIVLYVQDDEMAINSVSPLFFCPTCVSVCVLIDFCLVSPLGDPGKRGILYPRCTVVAPCVLFFKSYLPKQDLSICASNCAIV